MAIAIAPRPVDMESAPSGATLLGDVVATARRAMPIATPIPLSFDGPAGRRRRWAAASLQAACTQTRPRECCVAQANAGVFALIRTQRPRLAPANLTKLKINFHILKTGVSRLSPT